MQIKFETCLIHEFLKVLNLNLLKTQSKRWFPFKKPKIKYVFKGINYT